MELVDIVDKNNKYTFCNWSDEDFNREMNLLKNKS